MCEPRVWREWNIGSLARNIEMSWGEREETRKHRYIEEASFRLVGSSFYVAEKTGLQNAFLQKHHLSWAVHFVSFHRRDSRVWLWTIYIKSSPLQPSSLALTNSIIFSCLYRRWDDVGFRIVILCRGQQTVGRGQFLLPRVTMWILWAPDWSCLPIFERGLIGRHVVHVLCETSGLLSFDIRKMILWNGDLKEIGIQINVFNTITESL